jgi:hypothetical protein
MFRKKIQMGYSKIVANREKYNRRALGRLCATFWDHFVLYLSGLYPLLKKDDVKQIWTFYFRYCKFLLYLPPPWHSNGKIIRKFDVPDISAKLALLHGRLSESSFYRPSLHHPWVRLFG